MLYKACAHKLYKANSKAFTQAFNTMNIELNLNQTQLIEHKLKPQNLNSKL